MVVVLKGEAFLNFNFLLILVALVASHLVMPEALNIARLSHGVSGGYLLDRRRR
jgi:hypothetical protein